MEKVTQQKVSMGLSYKVICCTGATITKEKLKSILDIKRWNENAVQAKIMQYNRSHEMKLHRLCKETGELDDDDRRNEARIVFGWDGILSVKGTEDYLLQYQLVSARQTYIHD